MEKDIEDSIEVDGVTFVVKEPTEIPEGVHGSFYDLPLTETKEEFLVRMINGGHNSELDQDKVCEVCHGHGNNGADDASCLNCGGSGVDQELSK